MVSYLDLILLIPIGLAIWKGWKNGFVMEVFSMLALFVGIYAGIHLSDWMASFLHDKMNVQSENLPIISFVVVFLLVLVGLFFLGKLITQSVSAGGAERWNQIGGAFFSLTKTLLFLSITFVLFNALDRKYSWLPHEQKSHSYFYEPIYNFSLFLLPSVENSDFYKKLEEKQLAPIDTSIEEKVEASAKNNGSN
ncbi:MAG: CvpA family protein [Flavobacteriales bacterium]|nr:CvpA family protein [Flavobacteriales bacterium]